MPPLSPTRSPERSPGHSPTHTRSHNSSDAIIATHPNGRPLLPTLPRLAARLRLSTTSDDEEHPYDLDDEAERNNSPTRYNHASLTDAEGDQEDRARIERSLVEMMYRQRQRANPGGSSSSPRALRSGIGAVEEPEGRTREEEELLNLIMASLRDKVAVLDSEAWMYGESMEDTQAQV